MTDQPAAGSLFAYRRAATNLDNLSPATRAMAEALIAAGTVAPEAIISGFRDPEQNRRAKGAKGSQHMQGNAIDISTRGMTDEQRQALLQAGIANGARGIGIYPGGSLHFDTRSTPAFWGAGGSYRGAPVSAAPAWAQGDLQGLLGGGAVAPAPTGSRPVTVPVTVPVGAQGGAAQSPGGQPTQPALNPLANALAGQQPSRPDDGTLAALFAADAQPATPVATQPDPREAARRQALLGLIGFGFA